MDAQTINTGHGSSDFDEEPGHGLNGILQEAQRHKLLTAALIGGAVAAGAGAFIGTRALARRNGARDGQPLSSVMETAITASDLSATQAAKV